MAAAPLGVFLIAQSIAQQTGVDPLVFVGTSGDLSPRKLRFLLSWQAAAATGMLLSAIVGRQFYSARARLMALAVMLSSLDIPIWY